MGRGKGKREDAGCLLEMEGMEDVAFPIFSSKPPHTQITGFCYPDLIEYENETDFIESLREPCRRGGPAYDILSLWQKDPDRGIVQVPIERQECNVCMHSGECKRESLFRQGKEGSFLYELKKCPSCHGDFTVVTRFYESDEKHKTLHDVRLKGFPSAHKFWSNCVVRCDNPRCPKNGVRVSGARIPYVEAETRSGWTLRLLASCLDLSSKGISARVLAEGYGLKENTVRKRIRRLEKDLMEACKKQLEISLPLQKKPLLKETVILRGINHWIVFDGNSLYDFFPDEDVKQMNSFLEALDDGRETEVSQMPSELMNLTTFAGIGEHRTNLAVMELELLSRLKEIPMTASGESAIQMTELLRETLLEKEISCEKILDCGEILRLECGSGHQKVLRANRRLTKYVLEHKSEIERESRYGEFEPRRKLADYKWKPEQAFSDFRCELELVSACSEYTAEEQISRLLCLNQPALVGRESWLATSNPNKEYIWPDFENEEELTLSSQARLGFGVNVDCLRYMLGHGLLDANNGKAILCAVKKPEGGYGRVCDCRECPLGLEPLKR